VGQQLLEYGGNLFWIEIKTCGLANLDQRAGKTGYVFRMNGSGFVRQEPGLKFFNRTSPIEYWDFPIPGAVFSPVSNILVNKMLNQEKRLRKPLPC
jgi:hypothetical protein